MPTLWHKIASASLFFLNTEQISFFYKKPVMHRDLPWIKSILASSKEKRFFCSWAGFVVRNVPSVGSDTEYVTVFIWDTKGVPTKALFSDSGLRRDLLGHIFNRKSQPFMCMYKYCMHVIKPMKIPAFMWAKEIWMLTFAKGKRPRSDLKAKQCNVLRITILQWLIRECSPWG